MSKSSTEYLLITEYFHPDTASTGQLMTDLAVGLAQRGLNISVYTTQPNYHSGRNSKQALRSQYRGVPVRRIRAPQLRQSSLIRRLFNWTVFTAWMFVVLLAENRADRELVFGSNPPFLPIALALLCRLKGWEYTYVVYDFYPDVIVASGHIRAGGFIDRAWTRVNQPVLSGASNVIVLGPVMRDYIASSYPEAIDDDRIHVIHNWADEEFITPRSKEDNWFSQVHGLVENFSLVYSGNIGANHDLTTVIEAATAFRTEPVKFLIIGEGDNKATVAKEAQSLGLTDETVEFLPYQDRDVLPYSLTSGDVSIVSVDHGMKGLCVSSKIYTSLAVGQPVLLIAEEGSDEARIIRNHGAGISLTPGDTEAVEEAIDRWRSNPRFFERQGQNAREAFEEHYTMDQSIDEYYDVLTTKD